VGRRDLLAIDPSPRHLAGRRDAMGHRPLSACSCAGDPTGKRFYYRSFFLLERKSKQNDDLGNERVIVCSGPREGGSRPTGIGLDQTAALRICDAKITKVRVVSLIMCVMFLRFDKCSRKNVQMD
jgi:hypothetical protein